MAKIIDPDDLNVGTEITFNLGAKTFTLVDAGNLDPKEGVTGNALWAKFVDLWTTDTYQPYPFPMNVLDARSGQYIFGQDPGGSYNGWKPADDTTRQMIRDAGWSEYSGAGALNRQYVGLVALASGYPGGAQFYYQRTSTDTPNNFTFTDAPNEAIQVYGDVSNGNFDERAYFKLFCREAAYLYDDAILGDVGESATGAFKVSLPISVGSDLNIVATDAKIITSKAIASATWAAGIGTVNTSAVHGLDDGDYVVITGATPTTWNVRGIVNVTDTDSFEISIPSDPGTHITGGDVKTIYSLINIKYFDQAFNKEIDSDVTNRNFGILIDSGTWSGVDGSAPGGASVLTSSEGGMAVNEYSGGELIIHEGTDKGTVFPIVSNTATTITVTGTIASGSNLSFTAYPAVSIGATLKQIYTKVQYQLRQNSNINQIGGSVTGQTAGLLLNFVGSSLKCGFYVPSNSEGGGTGVMIEGLSDADINDVVFYDNTGVAREYPFASVGSLNFNAVLTASSTGYYRMYFTTLPGAGNDYGESGAVTVNDKDGNPVTGTINNGVIAFTFDYTGNNQGGRTPDTDAAVTVVAGNAGHAKPVVATGTITKSKGIVIVLTAETDRAYIA